MEQEASSFGDNRLDQASRFIHDHLASHGPDGIPVRRLGGNQAGEIHIGRFFRTGKVTEDRIIEPVAAATSSRVGGLHVLSIQDTTRFRDDGRGNGLVGHATIAVKAEQGTLLGILVAQLIERREHDPEPATGRSFRDRRSYRWMASMHWSVNTDLKLPIVPIEKWSTYRPIYSNKLLICRKTRFLGRVKRIAIKPALSFVQMIMCCVSLLVDNDRHRLVRTGQLPSP